MPLPVVLRILSSILWLVFLCGCTCLAPKIPSRRPESWSAELSKDAGLRWRGDEFLIEINERGRDCGEFVIRHGKRGKPRWSYKTLHVSKLSPEELAYLYQTVSRTFREFHFEEDSSLGLDGGYATLELRIANRSLSASFTLFGHEGELPSAMQRLLDFSASRLNKEPKSKPPER